MTYTDSGLLPLALRAPSAFKTALLPFCHMEPVISKNSSAIKVNLKIKRAAQIGQPFLFQLEVWRWPTLTWGDPTLPSAIHRFTTEFGMGSGGTNALWSSDKLVWMAFVLGAVINVARRCLIQIGWWRKKIVSDSIERIYPALSAVCLLLYSCIAWLDSHSMSLHSTIVYLCDYCH